MITYDSEDNMTDRENIRNGHNIAYLQVTGFEFEGKYYKSYSVNVFV